MKIKCPDCGSTIDIDRLREARDFREIIEIYKRLSAIEASLVGEYVDCFRISSHADMSPRKHLRILRETAILLEEGRFAYARRSYACDRSIVLEAIQKTVDTEKRAFTNHNYLKAIIIGLLKKRSALEEREEEERRKDSERRRSGPDEIPERGMAMPGWVKEKLRGI
jgi:hypothetical protein